ncbi:MAG: twin-arginine translocase subunit TatC [Firmicutes bacterium]|nr:twin-arginine translocase subunit TatC [Bacillota bacterium]
MHDREMSLTEHLTELRYRITVSLAVVGVLFLAGFFVSRPVLHWLIMRAHVKHIIVTGVPEAFFALIKVDLMMALIVASPVILYQVAAFVLPGLTPQERKVVGVVVGPGLVLFLIGMAGGFFIFVPLVLRVMLSFVGNGLSEYWTITNYLNFITYLTVPFGFLAELPLISGVMARIGLIQPAMFRRYRRYAIVIAFLIAAIVAPPDALSMLVIGGAIYLIYEVSYWVARLFYREPGAESQPASTLPEPWGGQP